jgi:hypothetical protein
MRAEYDFSGAVRGKYFSRYRRGTNVVLLDPDIAEVFRDSTAVNDALRALLVVARAKAVRSRPNKALQPTSRARGPAKKVPRGRAARS